MRSYVQYFIFSIFDIFKVHVFSVQTEAQSELTANDANTPKIHPFLQCSILFSSFEQFESHQSRKPIASSITKRYISNVLISNVQKSCNEKQRSNFVETRRAKHILLSGDFNADSWTSRIQRHSAAVQVFVYTFWQSYDNKLLD